MSIPVSIFKYLLGNKKNLIYSEREDGVIPTINFYFRGLKI